MRGIWNVVPAFLFVSLLVISTALAWSLLSPLVTSLNEVDPAWQSIKVGNIYNYREAIYLVPVNFTVSCGDLSWTVPVWFVVNSFPGDLKSVIITAEGGAVGIFERASGETLGFHVGIAPLYGVNRLIITTTYIRDAVEGAVYGSPTRFEIENVTRTVYVAKVNTECVIVLRGREIYRARTIAVEFNFRVATLR